MLSGLFLDPVSIPTATAAPVGQDRTTKGNWIGTYGTQGYNIIGNAASLPSYATVTPSGQSSYTWNASTTDPRPSGCGRHKSHRGLLVYDNQLHGGCEPDRRQDARPEPVLPRLEQFGDERTGAAHQRQDRSRNEYANGFVVHLGRITAVGSQRERHDLRLRVTPQLATYSRLFVDPPTPTTPTITWNRRHQSSTARRWARRSSTRRRAWPAPSPTHRPRERSCRRAGHAVGDLHADRYHRLHHGDRHGDDRRREGNAVASPGPIPPTSRTARALSSAQLDATASVAGTFTYTPAAGTVLDAGNGQTLSVTFTPTDTVDYNTADGARRRST